jgi:hypothetical protein
VKIQNTYTGVTFNMVSLFTNIPDYTSHKSSETSSKTIIHCRRETNLEVESHDAVTGILPGLHFRWMASFTKKKVSNGYGQLCLQFLVSHSWTALSAVVGITFIDSSVCSSWYHIHGQLCLQLSVSHS